MVHGTPSMARTDAISSRARVSSAKMGQREHDEDLITPVPCLSTTQSTQPRVSEYSPSVSSSDRTRSHKTGNQTPKSRDGKPRWLTHVKEWFNTSEPSAQDFKHLRKQEFKKKGVHMDDPDAHAKMHKSTGQIPRSAIKTAGGPNPDKQAIRRAEQRKRASYNTQSTAAASISSASSSSTRLRSPVAPWEV